MSESTLLPTRSVYRCEYKGQVIQRNGTNEFPRSEYPAIVQGDLDLVVVLADLRNNRAESDITLKVGEERQRKGAHATVAQFVRPHGTNHTIQAVAAIGIKSEQVNESLLVAYRQTVPVRHRLKSLKRFLIILATSAKLFDPVCNGQMIVSFPRRRFPVHVMRPGHKTVAGMPVDAEKIIANDLKTRKKRHSIVDLVHISMRGLEQCSLRHRDRRQLEAALETIPVELGVHVLMIQRNLGPSLVCQHMIEPDTHPTGTHLEFSSEFIGGPRTPTNAVSAVQKQNPEPCLLRDISGCRQPSETGTDDDNIVVRTDRPALIDCSSGLESRPRLSRSPYETFSGTRHSSGLF
jgi:hypothetical protein